MTTDFFSVYSSNTLAGSANQSWFARAAGAPVSLARVFYKPFAPGEYDYAFMFSDATDSTYSDGSHSRANTTFGGWRIESARAGVSYIAAPDAEIIGWQTLTFDGESGKSVSEGEELFTSSVRLNPPKDGYVCLEIAFSGEKVPYMEEAIIPVYVKTDGVFARDKRAPLPGMVGAARSVKRRIAFWGDSITEGIGTAEDSYLHWCARVADKLGRDYAFWNLGIGFGRAADAASGGYWLKKALRADFVNVCFGVNDILQGGSAEKLKGDLSTIARALKAKGIGLGLFTLPPFDMTGEREAIWREVNRFIKEELAGVADYVFDVVPVWGQDSPNDNLARYGGHPNAQGCEALARAFACDARLVSIMTGDKA